VIDKVEVRVSDFALPGPALAEPMSRLKEYPIPPFQSAKHYKYSADLRKDFNIDAVVHLNCRHGRHTHKVEILSTGKKTLEEMAVIIRQLFDVDPWSLELMRVDLAADIEDVPVSWFLDNAYVSRKRFSSRIEKSRETELQFISMGTATAETFYAGKRPVLIRIYNKLGEWRAQFRKLECDCQRFNARMESMELTPEQKHYGMRVPPTWEQFCAWQGYEYREGAILTRIESQIGGTRRLPYGLRTFGDLRYSSDLEPFKALRIIAPKPVLNVDAPPEGVSVRNWLAVLGFEALQQSHGSLQIARSIVIKHGQGNGSRILDSLSGFSRLPRPPLTLEEIQRCFRETTLKQTVPRRQNRVSVPNAFYEFEPAAHRYDQEQEQEMMIGDG
jgi:hypothetical protein